MKTPAWIVLLYGLLVLIGGLIGHLKAASTASLIAGTTFGVLLMISSIGMFKDKLFPSYIAILLTFLLDTFFTYRFLVTYKFFPSGLMSLISLVVLIMVVILIRNHLKTQRKKILKVNRNHSLKK